MDIRKGKSLLFDSVSVQSIKQDTPYLVLTTSILNLGPSVQGLRDEN